MATTISPLLKAPEGTPMSVSRASTRCLSTGTWRTFRPEYVTHASPCNLDCPAGTDVRAFLALAADGDAQAAWRTIVATNPLPGVCGRVCDHPCEEACNRLAVDEAVAVHAVERAIADRAAMEGWRVWPDTADHAGRQAAIIGSGPSGLSAAYHLARRGVGVTVFEAAAAPGGMLREGIPPYRLPRTVLDGEMGILANLGVRLMCGSRVNDPAELRGFDAIFLAPGLQRSRAFHGLGDDLPGVEAGLEFLRRVSRGERSALTGTVIVIGGGNTAIDAARVVRRLGAEATILYRREREDMPAHPDQVAQAEAEGVRFLFHAAPTTFVSDGARLVSVSCQRMRAGTPDASGRRRPEPIAGATFSLSATLALTAIGEGLEAEAFANLLDRTSKRFAADRWGRTPRVGVFAGGDATTGAGTVANAIGSGRRAADAMLAFLDHREPSDEAVQRPMGADDLNLFYVRPSVRVRVSQRHATSLLGSFDEVVGSLSWREGVEEARRCIACGSCTRCDNCLVFCPDAAISRLDGGAGYAIDLAHCKGCGICAAECPRGALALVPENQR